MVNTLSASLDGDYFDNMQSSYASDAVATHLHVDFLKLFEAGELLDLNIVVLCYQFYQLIVDLLRHQS